MKVIGLTGGIGSGKSTVSKILSEKGIKIIDADLIAREITSEKSIMDKLVSTFGSNIVDSDGKLIRKNLADIVFNNKKMLKKLNRITQKPIAEKILEEINLEKSNSDNKFVVVDSALPLKRGFVDVVDEIWVVHTKNDIRIKRVMERNNISQIEVENRIKSQMDEKKYLKLADIIICNDLDFETLNNCVENLYNSFFIKIGDCVKFDSINATYYNNFSKKQIDKYFSKYYLEIHEVTDIKKKGFQLNNHYYFKRSQIKRLI